MATNPAEICAQDGIATALHYVVNLAAEADQARTAMLEPYDAIALPKDHDIHRLEALTPTRNRPRGIYTTEVVEDFARAVNEQLDECVRTFVDSERWSATAVLNFSDDEGKQGHCDYLARLNVRPSPEWLALVGLQGQKFTQRGLIDFVEDWPHAIPGFTDLAGNSVTNSAAVAKFRAVAVDAQRTRYNTAEEMKTERGVLESIEARDADKWPALMTWACTPALGLQPITATVRLAVMTSHDTPTISARVVGFDTLREQVARNFAMLLTGKLDVAPFAGKFDPGV
jgi:uncharacterized protein YfdQ (DUF2303 family)